MKHSTRNKTRGSAREWKGKMKQDMGRMTHHPDMEERGAGEKMSGKVQRKVGEIQQVFDD